MIVVRLFRTAAPFQQIESRILSEGEFTIGRDPICDWQLSDRGGAISRQHCKLRLHDGTVSLLNTSRNGMEVGNDRIPVPKDQPYELGIGATLYLGAYMLTLDKAQPSDLSPSAGIAIESDGARSGGVTHAELLASFCAGAGLEPGTFAGEDALAVMEKLGAVYRQMIEDMCRLLRDRAECKAELQLDRTTVGGWKNNPFKWAPASSIAADLVKERAGGFLKGAEAVKASFQDLRDHSDALATAGRSSSHALLEALSPEALEAGVGSGASAEDTLNAFRRRHDKLRHELAKDSGFIGDSYREASGGKRFD